MSGAISLPPWGGQGQLYLYLPLLIILVIKQCLQLARSFIFLHGVLQCYGLS
jgi:hypothetical protein